MGKNRPFAKATVRINDHTYEVICHDFDSCDLINGKLIDVLYRWTQTINDFTTEDMISVMDSIGIAALNAHLKNVEGVFSERFSLQWPDDPG